MSDLISRKYLYDKMLEKEELARQRVLDTSTHSPAYLGYVAQLKERTALKHEIADAPTVEPPKGEWEVKHGAIFDYYECNKCHACHQFRSHFCPHCGCDMRKKVLE